eukprot:642661-Rhodomonas_salina.1
MAVLCSLRQCTERERTSCTSAPDLLDKVIARPSLHAQRAEDVKLETSHASAVRTRSERHRGSR